MTESQKPKITEQEAREVAEAARQKTWRAPSFMRELFLGNVRWDLVYPFPDERLDRKEFVEFYDKIRTFLQEMVNPIELDATGEYPPEVIDGLRRLGAFGMKVPVKYGGLSFTQAEYDKVMQLLGSWDASLGALLSAHQSIGVPTPLKMFGTDALKDKYLPRCAAGAISAFALTEPDVGSDPARLSTTIEVSDDGEAYILNGEKLWCTNVTLAELLVVMACDAKNRKISALVVEMAWPGVEVTHRCRFMGIKAISNGMVKFTNVRVPKENIIGREGQGLKIALTTLNTGRLALPATSVGGAKSVLRAARTFAANRVQWGLPIGKHEAIAHKLAGMAANIYAMESISLLASRMADSGEVDIRLEAAAAKEWNSARGWEVTDDGLQIQGGRGYETEASLIARGEDPNPIERSMRDCRINRIFEGSSEIMHLFMAREAVDTHLQVAGALVNPKATIGEKLAALPGIAMFYATWYPSRWLGWGWWPKYRNFGPLATHMRFVDRMSRKLARSIFHGMVVHQAKLERKQGFLFRQVDIGMELFVMAAACTRAQRMMSEVFEEGSDAVELADAFCLSARRRIQAWFGALWHNDDDALVAVSRRVLSGGHSWLEKDLLQPATNVSGPPIAAAPAAAPTEAAADPPAEAQPAKASKADKPGKKPKATAAK